MSEPRPGHWTHPRTPLPGLFLTGADVSSLGVAGAMMGGVTALGHLPGGISMPELMKAARGMRAASLSLPGHPQGPSPRRP